MLILTVWHPEVSGITLFCYRSIFTYQISFQRPQWLLNVIFYLKPLTECVELCSAFQLIVRCLAVTRSFCAKYNLQLRYHSAVVFNDKMCIMVCFMTCQQSFLSSVPWSAHPIFSPLHVFSMPCLRKKPPQLCHADIYFCLVKLPKCCGIFENSLYHL